MTWGELLLSGQKKLESAGIREYSLDGWYLFEHVFGMSRADYLLQSREAVTAEGEALEEFWEKLSRRAGREPLQHILGVQEFMGLEFYVNSDVLIPRQDTETLVETVLCAYKNQGISLLDVCTGSGCIAISLAALGKYAHVEAADISNAALLTAEKNAEKILGAGVVKFRRSDLFSAFAPEERFDVILSNPPYIPSMVIEGLEPEVRDFEPRLALDGSGDGLFFYRKLAEESRSFLKENGAVYFEIGYDQGEAVERLLSGHGFKDTKVIKDLSGKDRVVSGRWNPAWKTPTA
ncbi:peptide chain release factor N(5)-glutamine methyltransferase [Lachnospiraceae bacterium 45-P1]